LITDRSEGYVKELLKHWVKMKHIMTDLQSATHEYISVTQKLEGLTGSRSEREDLRAKIATLSGRLEKMKQLVPFDFLEKY
jgi:hypothetical protein